MCSIVRPPWTQAPAAAGVPFSPITIAGAMNGIPMEQISQVDGGADAVDDPPPRSPVKKAAGRPLRPAAAPVRSPAPKLTSTPGASRSATPSGTPRSSSRAAAPASVSVLSPSPIAAPSNLGWEPRPSRTKAVPSQVVVRAFCYFFDPFMIPWQNGLFTPHLSCLCLIGTGVLEQDGHKQQAGRKTAEGRKWA